MTDGFKPVQIRIFERAATDPGAPAIIGLDNAVIDYRTLCRRANSLAEILRSRGVGREDVVAVSLSPSADAIAAMIGILATGACYLPIDPLSPPARVANLLVQAKAAAIVADRPVDAGKVTVLGPRAFDAPDPPVPATDIHPGQLAYLIFTSGSTGQPKGVAMPHRGLARLIDWQCRSGPARLRTLAFAPVGFDVSLQEVLSTLASGGTLALCDDAIRQDPARLLGRLQETGTERVFLSPAALHRLAAEAARRGRPPPALRHVIVAGEALVVTDAIAGFFAALPGSRLDNHYGPTEAHLVTNWTLDGDPAAWPAMPPIGQAVETMTARVLTAGLAEAAVGETAELFVGGAGLARGYLGDPRRTAERFVPDPDGVGAVMYRTGDLARRSEAGVLAFAGRADDQIKVRGFRVEPGEVEHALCALPGVREAAVGLRVVADNLPVLVGYLVAEPGSTPDARALGEALGAVLPDFMVPARFLVVDSLPRTTSGKVDRAALGRLPLGQADEAPAPASPPDLVRTIWRRVLGHAEFDDDEDFFDVGGDSLLAVWVINELSRATGRDISLSVFLDAASVEGLAEALADAGPPHAARRSAELLTLRPGPPSRLLFLFHTLGGEVLAYRDFARSLSTPVRVLGVRMTPGWSPEGHSLEALAAAHVEEILALEPHGPYRLAGWSFGGALAFEVARQLRARGETVDFLGLIDANPALDPVHGERRHNLRYIDELDALLIGLRNGAPVPRFEPDDAVLRLVGGVLPEGFGPHELAGYLATTRHCLAAAQAYVPRPCDCRIDLFQANATPVELQQRLEAALRDLAGGGLTVRRIEADHFSLLRGPALGDLAGAFDTVLRASLAGEELVA
jgi:amino acid adenylation domain-containing protein